MIQETIHAALAPLFEGRVYPVYLPQSIAKDLAGAASAIYQVIDTTVDETVCGPGLQRRRVEIDIIAPSYAQVWALQSACVEALGALDAIAFEDAGHDEDWEFDSRAFRVAMIVVG